MNRKIMIVAAAEGFVIKGIETKLKSVLVDSVYSAPRIKDLKENVEHTDLILIFTDENIASTATAFSVINDSCTNDDRQVIVIGTRDEFQTLQKYIPASSKIDEKTGVLSNFLIKFKLCSISWTKTY